MPTASNTTSNVQQAVSGAAEDLSNKVQNLSDQAAPVIGRLSAQAEALTRKTVDAVREGSKRVRQQATTAADSTVNYIKEEPVKSVLIAAAAGAALLAIARFLARDKDNG